MFMEELNTGVGVIATTLAASDMAQIIETSGVASVPSIVLTVVNCLLLLVNAGITIYKKIKKLKNEDKDDKEDEDE